MTIDMCTTHFETVALLQPLLQLPVELHQIDVILVSPRHIVLCLPVLRCFVGESTRRLLRGSAERRLAEL